MEIKVDLDKESVDNLRILVDFIKKIINLKGGSSVSGSGDNSNIVEGFSAMFSEGSEQSSSEGSDSNNKSKSLNNGIELY